jgi:hypothetical protein
MRVRVGELESVGLHERMTLSKEQSRLRWRELRDLWNEWDPIGVLLSNGGPADEYDSYLGPSLRLLEQGASSGEIERYLEEVIGNHMGLGQHGINYVRSTAFATKLSSWFSSRWAGSHI